MTRIKSRYRRVWSTPAPMRAPLSSTVTDLRKPTCAAVYPLFVGRIPPVNGGAEEILDRNSQERGYIQGALRHLPRGVYVRGTRRGREANAMTASWVMETSERPPCVAVAVRNDRYSVDLIL